MAMMSHGWGSSGRRSAKQKIDEQAAGRSSRKPLHTWSEVLGFSGQETIWSVPSEKDPVSGQIKKKKPTKLKRD